MTLIALIHVAWLSLLPIGIIIAIRGVVRRRRLRTIAGFAFVVLSVPAVAFCTPMWPFDFLIPGTVVRVPVTAGTYVVTLVQRPGVDFYDLFFEIRRVDGKITRVMIDCDSNKWWRPRVIAQGTRSYFVRGFQGIMSNTSYVDAATGTLFGGYYGQT
jgi:hypothetical protein